jgi:hypothetical protein
MALAIIFSFFFSLLIISCTKEGGVRSVLEQKQKIKKKDQINIQRNKALFSIY